MKNFRKVLALVLAVATLFSFAAMASAATVNFTDAGEITKAEAVDVLVALGVVNGYTDGSFGPKGDVTRAEMATMISKMMNKGLDVNARWTNACTFTDMTGVEWAAGHVAFNASEGYIAGRNATTFAPNDKVTGAEAAKMLLCALGYDAQYNGLVGADWSKNTVKLASKLGLFENVDSAPEAALNRENAAQILLNTLEAPMVEFQAGSSSTIAGITVVTGGKQEELTNRDEYYTGDDLEYIPTAAYLIETLFTGAFKTDDADWAGRKAFTWTYGAVVGTYGTGEIFKTYTGFVPMATLYTDLGEVDGAEFNTITAAVNGATEPTTATAVAGMTKYSTMTEGIAFPGATTEVYYDRLNKTLDIVIIAPYFGVIDSVDEDAEEAYVTFGDNWAGTLEDVAFTENDVETPLVCYASEADALADPELIAVEKATVVTGTLTNVSGGADTVITVDGTVYSVSALVDTTNVANYLGNKVTMYTDKNGVVIAIDAADVSADLKYAYVIDTGLGETIYTGAADMYAYLLFADGKAESVKVKATNDVTALNLETLEGHIVGYTVKDGVYTLKDPTFGAITAGSTTAVESGNAAINTGVKATNKSVFVVDLALDSDYQNQITVAATVYTGIKNVPGIEASNIAYLVDGYGSVIIAFANDATLSMGYTGDVDAIRVTGQERVEATLNADEELVAYTEYTAIVDGAVTTIKVEAGSEAANAITADADGWILFSGATIVDGFYTDINTTTGVPTEYAINASGWEKYKDGVIFDGTDYISVEETTVAYIYNTKTLKLSVSTVDKIGSRLNTSESSFYVVDETALSTAKPVVALYVVVNG